jgi:DNA-binding CsgD family transcriptional regulator
VAAGGTRVDTEDVHTAGTGSAWLAGRTAEQQLLHQVLEAAAGGTPGAVLVQGEAGVGKTRLVQAVCDEAADHGFTVLWGRCVRAAAVEAPYRPLLTAVRGWLVDADPERRRRVLTRAGVAPADLRLLDEQPGTDVSLERAVGSSGGAMRLLDLLEAVVLGIAAQQPVALVVDDIHWADLASRDALAYLVAGFHRQRIALLATWRVPELRAGDPTLGWLADLRHLPGVTDLRLERLTCDETEQQLEHTLGGAVHPRLAQQVFAGSGGNPYLTDLLSKGVDRTTEELPRPFPAHLGEALLDAWWRLSPSARRVTGLLSMAGRPAATDDVMSVARKAGLGSSAIRAALAEATEHGVLVRIGEQGWWFRHPMLAELLPDNLLDTDPAEVHAAWAETLAHHQLTGVDEMRRLGDLSWHLERSGNTAEALASRLAAADLAEQLSATREAAAHLTHATRLWPAVNEEPLGPTAPTAPADHVALLERTCLANERVGSFEAAFDAVTQARALVDETEQPLLASRLLPLWVQLAAIVGTEDPGDPTQQALHAVDLTSGFPASEEHALALARLSGEYAWRGGHYDAALEVAERARAAADAAGSSAARAAAQNALTLASMRTPDPDFSFAVIDLARSSGRPAQLTSALTNHLNVLADYGRFSDVAELSGVWLAEALDRGEFARAEFMAGFLAGSQLYLGRLEQSAAAVRRGLSLVGLTGLVMLRVFAVGLAVRQGRMDDARIHVARAWQLCPNLTRDVGTPSPPLLAEHLRAQGRHAEAVDLLVEAMPTHRGDPGLCDEMLLAGAQSLAEMVERGGRVTAARQKLQRLQALREAQLGRAFVPVSNTDRARPALQSLFEAQLSRLEEPPGAVGAWAAAVRAAAHAGMRWDAALSSWHWAEALAAEGAPPSAITEPLRSAHDYALSEGAVPLRVVTETTATACGLHLDEPRRGDDKTGDAAFKADGEGTPPPFDTLTARELDVVRHLMAGHTYRETADALFISAKTVSTHVSHVLRKTGTRTRSEVATLAHRRNLRGSAG